MKKLLIILLTIIIAGLALQAQATDFGPAMGPGAPGSGLPPGPGSYPPPQGGTSCTGYPDISVDEILPENIWAPAGEKIAIEISGVIAPALGCEILSASYTMGSDSGFVTGDIGLGTGGLFHETIMVDLSKDGKFKEGKTYRGLVTAIDSYGHKTTVGFYATVLHDKGKK